MAILSNHHRSKPLITNSSVSISKFHLYSARSASGGVEFFNFFIENFDRKREGTNVAEREETAIELKRKKLR